MSAPLLRPAVLARCSPRSLYTLCAESMLSKPRTFAVKRSIAFVHVRAASSSSTARQQYRRFGEEQPVAFRIPGAQGQRQQQSKSSLGDRKPLIYVVAIGGGSYIVFHLEKVPETGRYRFIDVSETTERAMGDQAAEEILQQYKHSILPPNDQRVRQVTRVAHRILQASGLDPAAHNSTGLDSLDKWKSKGRKTGVDWKVYVIKDEQANAFVLPNGTICVFTGLLPIVQNEDGLAAVLGHEIGHQVARHGAERMSMSKISVGLQLLLASLGIDVNLASGGIHYLLTLPNSRTNETEADNIGLKLAATACYDPEEAVHVWERMQKAAQGAPPQFLSTHPSNQSRINKIKTWLPEVMTLRNEVCGSLSEFKQISRQ